MSGEGVTRILYMNTCDEKQVWTTSHCDNQETPQLTVQNLTFVNGNSKSETEDDGGGAIFAQRRPLQGHQLALHEQRVRRRGPDVGGGAIRVFQQ